MISAYHDDHILVLTRFLQLLDQDPKSGIEGGDLPKIIGQVLSDRMSVRQECRHLALEPVGIDPPKFYPSPWSIYGERS